MVFYLSNELAFGVSFAQHCLLQTPSKGMDKCQKRKQVERKSGILPRELLTIPGKPAPRFMPIAERVSRHRVKHIRDSVLPSLKSVQHRCLGWGAERGCCLVLGEAYMNRRFFLHSYYDSVNSRI